MAQHVVSHSTHILRNHVATTLNEGVSPCCLGQIDRGTWRTTKRNHVLHILQTIAVWIAGGKDDVGNILLNLLVNIYLANNLTGLDNLFSGCHGRNGGQCTSNVLTDNLLLLFNGRIANDDLQHKTVHLGFRQRIGTFLLDGVLRSHHQEGIGQFKGVGTNGDLFLLHGLEQGALYLCWCTVDFVCQYEVGKYGTFLHLELLILLRVNHRTRHVSRQQVGGKLYTTVCCIYQLRQRLDSQRLSQTWHTF